MSPKVPALHFSCLLNKESFYLAAIVDRFVKTIQVFNNVLPVFFRKKVKIVDERVQLFFLLVEYRDSLIQFFLSSRVTTIKPLTNIFNVESFIRDSIISIHDSCIIEIIRNDN